MLPRLQTSFYSLAAVFVLGLSQHAFAVSTVTAVTTNNVTVTSAVTRTGIAGTGGPYSITYDGVERQLATLTGSGQTFAPTTFGVAVARRNTATAGGTLGAADSTNPNQTTAWNRTAAGTTGTSHTVSGQYVNTMDALFTSRNIQSGTENLFVNTAGTTGDVVNNVERMDFYFSGGFLASASTAFAIFERGNGGSGANGGFRVAAITAVNGAGTPTAFTDSILIAENSYQNGSPATGVGIGSINYDVFRYNTVGGPNLDNLNNANIGPQNIAGVLINTTDLVTAGTRIYGYAVMAEDVTATAANLVDWTNSTNYSTSSGFTNDVDMVATGAAVYTLVPEPATYGTLGMGIFLIGLTRRFRRA